MKSLKNLFCGILLIALGIIFALNSLGVTDIDLFFEGWWTLFIIIPSISGLVTDRDKTGSVVGLVIGVALLLSARGIIDFSTILKLVFPAILVIIGLSLILKNFLKKAEKNDGMAVAGASGKEYLATFSGQDVKFDGEVFEGAELSAVFGGVKCDIRNAIIEKDVVINASAVFGGVTVLVPEGVNVKIKSSALFGGVSDAKKRPYTDGATTIYVNADAMFGGVDIK